MGKRREPAGPTDKIDRAVTSIKGAIGRLVGLLGDEDDAGIAKAIVVLTEIGPFAIGPLTAALPRAPSPRHRLAIVGALLTFGPQAPVLRALAEAEKRDPDARVQTAADVAFMSLLMTGQGSTRRSPAPAGDRPDRIGRPTNLEG